MLPIFLLAIALAAIAAPPAVAQEPACSLAPTNGTESRAFGGRSYLVSVPPGLSGDRVPLLVSVHGFSGSPSQQEQGTGWTPFAAAHGFIVAYPQGRPTAYTGAWDPYSPVSDDVAFIRSVVVDIAGRWCVDPARIHADGWSNGAVMSQRLACAAPDLFASASSYAGGPPTGGNLGVPCAPARPISVMLLAGRFDFTYAGLASNAADWRAIDGCGATPVNATDSYGVTDTWACANGSQVVARVVENTSHNWPSGAQGDDQRRRMWAFFEANPKPA
jgi:polyhydroxybutyrate depolymerase